VAFDARPSMLSSEHPDNSYRGLVNVMIILLILANLRIVIQNLCKYGVLVRPSSILYLLKMPNIMLTMSIWIYIFAAYGIEMLHGIIPAPIVLTMHFLNACASFLGPWYGMWLLQTDPGGGIIALVFAATAFMKITSFYMMCGQLREEYARKDKKYKATIKQLLYFIAAPTLVFRDSYPRSESIRWGWLMRRVAEFIGLWAGIFIVATQYVVPSVGNTFQPLESGNVMLIVEGVLKIAVPNLVIWLIGFYAIFHVYLNILGEITRFGDRQFYKDWWNSTTLGYFWRSWNLPVHGWMVAHVYLPLTNRGWRKSTASLLIFFISAVLHELVVSIPFWNFKLLAFGGMMLQVVLRPETTGV
jgi:diacylglycerol O-acyltransferase-1